MKTRYWPVVLLLLVHFFIRIHHNTLQVPHVDEGFHTSRATVVWSFDQNPGRFMHGKLLLYYWLGLFDPQPITGLFVTRTAIAISSLITAAMMYLLGRFLKNHEVGLLALGLYAFMPFSVFFERVAMADAFAAGFAMLVVWRSLILARRPSRREGVILGVLITAAMMAKLTMAPIAFMAPLAAIVYYPWNDAWRQQIGEWRRRYMPHLWLAAGIVVLAWQPILIPAIIARFSDEPFTLLSEGNLQQIDNAAPISYWLSNVYPQLVYLTTHWFYFAFLGAVGYLLWQRQTRRHTLMLLGWLLLLAFFSLIFANRARPRYFMPTVIPMLLLLAYAAIEVWHRRRWVGAAVFGAMLVWLIGFAIPFDYTAMTQPLDLELSGRETRLYLIGTQSGPAVERAAALLEAEATPLTPIYAPWGLCQAFYFYTDLSIRCLTPTVTLSEVINYDLSYVVLNGDEDVRLREQMEWERLARFPRDGVPYTVEVYQVTRPTD